VSTQSSRNEDDQNGAIELFETITNRSDGTFDQYSLPTSENFATCVLTQKSPSSTKPGGLKDRPKSEQLLVDDLPIALLASFMRKRPAFILCNPPGRETQIPETLPRK
jgi:hypothetical protein